LNNFEKNEMATINHNSVEERLDRIESTLNSIAAGMNQAPVMLSMATDSFDEIVGNAKNDGIYLEDRIQNGLHLLKRLSDPHINKTINGLIDTLEQAPGLISMFVDIADESAGNANSGSVKLQDRIDGVMGILDKVSHPSTINNLEKLLEISEQAPGLMSMAIDTLDDIMSGSKSLDPDNLAFIKHASNAITESISEPPTKIGGLFGMLKVIKDPDRLKALGLIMNILKKLGNKL
jgi:uncharacterized protein YjgD (DUF1641 family)